MALNSPPRRGGRSRLTIALLVLTTITVLTLDLRGVGFVDDARHAVGRALSPLQGVAGHVTTPFENAWGGITDYGTVKSENDELRERVAELETQIARADEIEATYGALADELDIPWVLDIPTATAKVVQQPASAFSYIVVIDKGESSGIRTGMPVVTGAGLVGRVVDVDAGRSSVQLLTDPEFRVGVKLVTSGEIGTLQGRGSGRDLVMDTSIEPEEDVAELPIAEMLITAGSDDGRSSYPPFLHVARATGIDLAPNGLTMEVSAEPLVDLTRLDYVQVLLRTPAAN